MNELTRPLAPIMAEGDDLELTEKEELSLFPAATLLQLFAYYVSNSKGLDVDKPRNLAKSVTVE